MSNIILKRFMIFNSSEGHHESQEGDKLLYHWTKEAPDNKVSLAEQIDDVCLCDASVNISIKLNTNHVDPNQTLTKTPDDNGDIRYSDDNDDHVDHDKTTNDSFEPNETKKSLVLTFEKTLILIVEIEPKQSIWMAVHVAPPTSILDNSSSSNNGDNSSTTSTTNTTIQHINPNLIPTYSIERVMNNIYTRFCLLNGDFQLIADNTRSSIKQEEDLNNDKIVRALIRDKMRNICNSYFDSVLPDLHLNSIISNVGSLYNYILYLDLNPITLMKVNSFINHLVCINAIQLRHTIVIFNEQLLWSSLNIYDTRLLYNYLVSVLVRDALQEELSKEVEKIRRIKEDLPIYLTDDTTGTYIDHDESEMTATSMIQPNSQGDNNQFVEPKKKKKKLNKFYFTVFRSSNNMTLGLILSEPNLLDLTERCEQILTSDSRLGVIPLASLAQSVGQNFLKASSHSSHNHHNHSTQSSHQQSQQAQHLSSATSTTSLGSSSNLGSNRRIATSSLRNALQFEQKYIYMDKLDVSISWPLSMDMLNKDQLLLSNIDSFGSEVQPTSKKLRLIKYLIELEPELEAIRDQSGSFVEEFFAKTVSDSWLTVTNSRYRTIYSIHNTRNFGLTEAQQSAITLKSVLAGNIS